MSAALVTIAGVMLVGGYRQARLIDEIEARGDLVFVDTMFSSRLDNAAPSFP